ncbi:GNAT family N-acetyltransferase [Rhizobium laguerreae]|uniref:GNAT family N-acetyltransferase n=1 Tax=Rhizobium laguerreae TaxID=1076926 RepID=UPI003CCEC7E5
MRHRLRLRSNGFCLDWTRPVCWNRFYDCSEGCEGSRRVSSEDAEARFALGTDAEIVNMFGVSLSDAKPMTRDAAEQWAEGQANNPYAWAIEVEGCLVGEIKLHSINVHDRRASMAIGIDLPLNFHPAATRASVVLNTPTGAV